MTWKLLDGTNVETISWQVGGEGMAKRVTGDAFRETACSTAAFSDVLAGMQTANTIPRWRSDIYGPSAMLHR